MMVAFPNSILIGAPSFRICESAHVVATADQNAHALSAVCTTLDSMMTNIANSGQQNSD
jgi:hypothetical protein